MTNEKLDKLVETNCILSYEYVELGEDGQLNRTKFRNTEKLRLNFPNGDTLVVDTFCSGSAEDTVLFFS